MESSSSVPLTSPDMISPVWGDHLTLAKVSVREKPGGFGNDPGLLDPQPQDLERMLPAERKPPADSP